jgi:hypothetical protein
MESRKNFSFPLPFLFFGSCHSEMVSLLLCSAVAVVAAAAVLALESNNFGMMRVYCLQLHAVVLTGIVGAAGLSKAQLLLSHPIFSNVDARGRLPLLPSARLS